MVIGSDDGVLLFASIEAAEGHLEPTDVEDRVYRPAFDADGRLLRVDVHYAVVTTPSRGWLGALRHRMSPERSRVCVTVVEAVPSHQEQLNALLLTALTKVKPTACTVTVSHDPGELLSSVVEKYGVLGAR